MSRVAAGLASLLLAACAVEPSAEEAPTPPTQLHVSVAAGSAPRSHCSLRAGRTERSVMVGDTKREYVVEVGSRLAEPPPVVFMWHGFGGRVEVSREAMDAPRLWNDGVLVTPVGLPRTFEKFGSVSRPGWQIEADEFGGRDLAFFDALVHDLKELGCLDSKRVYSTGFSNGGFFSNVLACHRGDVVAAVAPTSGGGPFETPCGTAVPVLVTHGRIDRVVPHTSGQKSFNHWARHNHCGPQTPETELACKVACPGTAEVQMCTSAGGHRWPKGQADRVSEFFRRFTKE